MPLGTVYVGEESPRAGAEPVFGYRLLQRLGSGGHGEVWRAEAPGGFQVAMKFMRLDSGLGRSEARALEILRGLRHPNLLMTFGAWEIPGYLVLGMELADRTLWDRFCECVDAGQTGIPRDELIDYLAETAKGVDYLNEPKSGMGGAARSGIQHRDLKPQNILLAGGGVKVGDFGLARQLDQSIASHTGHWTFAYAAPEFFRRQTSGQSDQYSLAATYCHLRGGQPPFNGPPAVIMAGHLLLAPELNMIPEEERPVVARALSKAPKDRWPSCRSFIEALRTTRPVAVPVAAPASMPPGPRRADVEILEAAELASSDEIVIRAPAPTTKTGLPPAPADPTEWTTRVFDEEFADIPEVLAVALDSSDDDLPVYIEVPPTASLATDDDTSQFEAQGLLAVLNELPVHGWRSRFLKVGLVAAALLAAVVGLWVVGGNSNPGRHPVDLDKIMLAAANPAIPAEPTPDRAEPPWVPAEAEKLAPQVKQAEVEVRPDQQVAKVALREVEQPRPVPPVPPADAASQGPPLDPPLEVDLGPPPAEAEPAAIAITATPEVRHTPRVRLSAPARLTVQAGGSASLDVEAVRDGFAGPLTARFERLPEGIRAEVASFPPGGDRTRVEIRAEIGTPGGEAPARLVARVGDERIEVPVTVVIAASAAQDLLVRGKRLFSQGQFDEAATILDEAIKLDPRLSGAYVTRGSIFVQRKEYERAIVYFKEAIRHKAADAVVFNNRGLAYSGRGDYYLAICDYSEALRLNPTNATIRYNRGRTYHLIRDEQMALEDLNKAIELNPEDAIFYETRAEVLDNLNERGRARQDRDKARSLGGSTGRSRAIRPIPAPLRSGKPAGTKRAARIAVGATNVARPG